MIDYSIINDFVGTPWVYKENDCWVVVKKASAAIFGRSIVDQIKFPDRSEKQFVIDSICDKNGS